MQTGHGIHEIGHVTRADGKCLVQNVRRGSRMSDRDDPTPSREFLNQLNPAIDLWRDGHHVNRSRPIKSRKGIEVVNIFEGAKVFTMKRAALLIVNERTFVMHTEDACAGFQIHSLSFHELIDRIDSSLVSLGRIRHECRYPRCDSTL